MGCADGVSGGYLLRVRCPSPQAGSGRRMRCSWDPVRQGAQRRTELFELRFGGHRVCRQARLGLQG